MPWYKVYLDEGEGWNAAEFGTWLRLREWITQHGYLSGYGPFPESAIHELVAQWPSIETSWRTLYPRLIAQKLLRPTTPGMMELIPWRKVYPQEARP